MKKAILLCAAVMLLGACERKRITEGGTGPVLTELSGKWHSDYVNDKGKNVALDMNLTGFLRVRRLDGTLTATDGCMPKTATGSRNIKTGVSDITWTGDKSGDGKVEMTITSVVGDTMKFTFQGTQALGEVLNGSGVATR